MKSPVTDVVGCRGATTPAGTYALVTPARNEATFIEKTILSVVSQTARPVKWVIVSDGSTDGTEDIVKRYAARYDWIELLRTPERTERHFAGKAHAFNGGVERMEGLDYDLIGNVDADISFEPDFFSFLLRKFEERPRLGVAGTAFTEDGAGYDYRFASLDHVSGQCQLFRRECLESIGGYLASVHGGIDVMAVLAARMKGWETKTFQERRFFHHRRMGGAKYGHWVGKLRDGQKDYLLGGHPLWEVFRCLYQMRKRPYFVGGFMIGCGYLWSGLRRKSRTMPDEMIRFRRRDQMRRLKEIVSRFAGR